MKILVTGASGFIGSRLVARLRNVGHEVLEMVRYQSGGRFSFYDQKTKVFVDLRDSRETRDAIIKAKPDVIVHLAAMSAVSYSFSHPEEVNEVNYMGTVRVAEAALEIGAHVIMAGTSEVYGRGDHKYPLTESEPYGSTSPYAASKVAAIEYLRTLESIHKLPVTIMLPFNTIGRAFVYPAGNRHFVVERAVTQAIEDGVISLYDPEPVRDFMFREDHVGAYLAVIQSLKNAVGQSFNVCTGEAVTIRNMAEIVANTVGECLGKKIDVNFAERPDRPLDISVLHGSNRKIYETIGWRPAYGINQSLSTVVDEWISVLRPGTQKISGYTSGT